MFTCSLKADLELPKNGKEYDMKADSSSLEQDEKALISILNEMCKSMTGAQSTKEWANDAIWFDVAPFASRGIETALKQFDSAFSQLSSFVIDILRTDSFINGDMAILCSVQKWSIVTKDGTHVPPMLIRQTNCFERRQGEWKVIHEHSSVPASQGWDGGIVGA